MENKDLIFSQLAELALQCRSSGNILFEGEINENTRLIEDLAYESISIMGFIVEIESKYDITFDDDMLLIDKFNNLSLLSDLVNSLLVIKND